MTSLIEKLSNLLVQRQTSLESAENALSVIRQKILNSENTVNDCQKRVIRYRREYTSFLKRYEQTVRLSTEAREQKEVFANVIETKMTSAKDDLTVAKKRLTDLNKKLLHMQNLRKQIQVQISHIEKRHKAIAKAESKPKEVNLDDLHQTIAALKDLSANASAPPVDAELLVLYADIEDDDIRELSA